MKYKKENNQILVEINGSKFTQEDAQYIQQLPEILDDSTFLEEDYGEKFEVGNLHLTINKVELKNEIIDQFRNEIDKI